ncbi:hypothetical protein ACTMTJ_35790 [Phytohabitans sp. LJ34]|uniref:hypothetical protein n=1 Tax=Phytohabitans sp. LJ34 TaxID=3452217 RepID=UPI003F8962AE
MSGPGAMPARALRPATAWRRVAEVATAAPAPVALLAGHAALRGAEEDAIGSLGLVDVLPMRFWAAILLLTVGFAAALFLAARPVVLAGYVVAFTVLLHGAASIVESMPRFVPAWLHVGFADYIARTGQVAPDLDARFSWPGFFTLSAMLTRVAGLPDAMPLLDWMPVAANLCYAAVVYRLARLSFPDSPGAWLVVWLFVPANWVGQDYFSPQAVNFLFYLLIFVALLVWFRTSRLDRLRHRQHGRPRHGAGPPGRTLRLPRPMWILRLAGLPRAPLRGEPEPVAAGGRTLAGVMVVVLLLFTASTMSHQLTPVAMVAPVVTLVLARRCAVRALPALLVVILAGYLSYLAQAYWSGHLDELLTSFGRLGQTVDSGIADRVRGDPGHLFALRVRQWLTLGVWGLAAFGAWRSMRRGRGDLAVFVLALAPFLLLFAQSYGGEVFLRVYLFALPFAVVLAVAALLPARHTAVAAVLTVVVSLAMTGAFFVARYGNESFERVRPGDVAAVEWLYANAAPGSTFVALTFNVTWRARHVDEYRYTPLTDDRGPDEVTDIEATMRTNPRGAYLILTPGQYVMAESFFGRPSGWGEAIERQVATSGLFRLVYAREGAKIFVLA